MKASRRSWCALFLGVLVLRAGPAQAQTTGSIVAWGELVAVATGTGSHSLALRSDGTVAAWGFGAYGQCDVPSANADFIAVSGGMMHSVGLKSGGRIVVWGDSTAGQYNLPQPNRDFVAVSGGTYHSLGLKRSSSASVEEPRFGQRPARLGIEILSLAPNPWRSSTDVFYQTRVTGPVIMEIHDASGRRVKTATLGTMDPSLHRAGWDGTGGSGASLASGVYFIRLRNPGARSGALRSVLIR